MPRTHDLTTDHTYNVSYNVEKGNEYLCVEDVRHGVECGDDLLLLGLYGKMRYRIESLVQHGDSWKAGCWFQSWDADGATVLPDEWKAKPSPIAGRDLYAEQARAAYIEEKTEALWFECVKADLMTPQPLIFRGEADMSEMEDLHASPGMLMRLESVEAPTQDEIWESTYRRCLAAVTWYAERVKFAKEEA